MISNTIFTLDLLSFPTLRHKTYSHTHQSTLSIQQNSNGLLSCGSKPRTHQDPSVTETIPCLSGKNWKDFITMAGKTYIEVKNKQIMNPDFLFELLKIGAKIAQEKHRKSLVISKIPFSRNIITKCNGIDNQLYGGSIGTKINWIFYALEKIL